MEEEESAEVGHRKKAGGLVAVAVVEGETRPAQTGHPEEPVGPGLGYELAPRAGRPPVTLCREHRGGGGGQMRRWGQRVTGSASMLSKLRQALLLEGSGQRLSWAAEAWSEMYTRLWWSRGAAGGNALGLGARLE